MAINQQGYTGIAFPFRFSGGGRVTTSTTSEDNFTHIKENIIQTVLTNLGERVFQPKFGSDVRSLVFDKNDQTSSALIKAYVRESLTSMMDRIEIDNITLDYQDGNESILVITLSIYVKKYLKSDNVVVIYNQGGDI